MWWNSKKATEWALIFLGGIIICGCYSYNESIDETPITTQNCFSLFQYPLPEKNYLAGFQPAASFLKPTGHLGEDISSLAETPVRSIANGTIVWYGPSRGYGALAVVIEHTLDEPISLQNGNNEIVTTTHLLSIYGYLRKNKTADGFPLLWEVGQNVHKGEVVGYVNDDDSNGIGREHVHVGIRLESADEARNHDPTGWFRAYDRGNEFRKYYTAPSSALATLTNFCFPIFDLSLPAPDTER